MVTEPTSDAGGFQSNSYVPGFGWTALYPAKVCSMYWSGRLAGQAVLKLFCCTKSREEHINWVRLSVGTKAPATLVTSESSRAVSSKPHRRCLESSIATTRCCVAPGV